MRVDSSFSFELGYINDPGSTEVQIYGPADQLLGTVVADSTGFFLVTSDYSDASYFVVTGDDPAGWEIDTLSFVDPTAVSSAPRANFGIATSDGGKHSTTCTNGKNPVNCASGDFWHTFTDASVTSYGPSLDLTRTYNSLNASTEGIFGYGWSSSYDMHLVVNEDSSITITEADGSQVTAEPDGSDFTMPTWADSTLTTSGSDYVYDDQGSDTYTFNSSGQLITITDPNDYSTTLTYTSGTLTTVTDAAGQTLTFAYGENGLVSSVTDPMSRETTYAYDGNGNLTSVTDPDGNVTSFTYDDDHLLLTMTFPNGQSGGPDAGDSVTNTYNDSGQVLTQTDQMGNETTYAYTGDNFSDTGGTTTITDPDGNVEVESYVDGQLQTVTKGSSVWNYGFDQSTFGETSVQDPDGNVTTNIYDENGNLISTTNALGNTTSYTVNSFNEQTCEAEPLSTEPCSALSPPPAITAGTATITPPDSAPPPYVTYSVYDTDGNLIYTTTGDYAPGSDTATQLRTIYDLYNGQSVTLGAAVDSCTTGAPSTELPCATINANGIVTQLAYDSDGDLTSKSTPDGSQGQSPGVISTVMGAPMGSVVATQTFQDDAQLATATIGGTSYAYVADQADAVVRRINLTTDDETVVAGDYDAGNYGNGYPATSAELGSPEGVAVDSSGDIAIADTENNVVWFVPASSGTYFGQSMTSGDIYVVAGDGTAGATGNGGVATSAELDAPSSVAFAGTAIVVADTDSNEVRLVPDSSDTYFGQSTTAGDIYAIAGTGTAGYSGDNGAATSANLNAPGSVAVDAEGDLLIADTGNNVVRFVPASSGTYFGQTMTADDIYTVAGNGTAGYSGDGGAATSAELSSPGGVAVDAAGDLVVADTDNNVVRFVPASTGTYFGESMTADDIYTVAGTGTAGESGNGGLATSADIDQVTDVGIDAGGDLLLSVSGDSVARIVAASSGTLAGQSVTAGDIYALAGTGSSSIQSYTGPAADGQLDHPGAVTADAAGDLYIADGGDSVVRFIPKHTGTYYGQSMTADDVYTIAGDGTGGSSGDGGPATAAEIYRPFDVAVDSSGDVAISLGSDAVRFIPSSSGTYFGQSMTADDIYTIAGGNGGGYSGDGGPATSAKLYYPNGVTFDAAGDLIIADTYNNAVRFVPVSSGTYFGQSMTADDIYTIGGNGTAGYSGDGGPATAAELNLPDTVAVDAGGDVLVADSSNNVVRFIPVSSGTYFGQSMTADYIYTIAGTGTGTAGYSGNGGAATSAELSQPDSATFDAGGNLLIVDAGNDVVRFVPATSGEYYGVAMTADDIYTVAGTSWTGLYAGGDGGPPLDASFAWISSVAPDSAGGFYIVDFDGNRVRYVSDAAPTSVSTTTYTYDADGEVTSVTTPDGNVEGANAANSTTTYTYNDDGEVTAATQGGGEGATVTARTTTYTYDGDGNETSTTDPRGNGTNYTYNADDEETLVTNADSDATLTCYDGDGNVAETVPPVGVAADSLTAASCPTTYPTDYGDRLATDATTTAYNALGEKTTVTSPAPAGLSGYETTTYAYNLDGWLTSVTAPPTSTADDASNDVTQYTYDDIGELLTTTTGYGTATASTTSSCYDPDGNVTATVPGDGNVSSLATCSDSSHYDTSSPYQTSYQYDSLGELLTRTAPETTAAPGGQVTTYTYDPEGNELTETTPNGVISTNTYSPLNQLLSVSYSDGTSSVTYAYDANGNLTGMVDGSGTTTNVYDPFNELTSTTDGAGDTTSYTYDLDGDVTGIIYPLGDAWWASTDTVAYAYDDADQLASITDFNGNTSDVTETADGLPSALTLGASGDTVSTSYAANDESSSITLGDGSTLQEFAYSDAPSGAIATETDTPSSDLSPADYTYDAQSQVIGDTTGTSAADTYAEDASGNLTTLPNGASGTYDDASELTSLTGSGTTVDFTYDAAGNRTGATIDGSPDVTDTLNGNNQLETFDNSEADMSSATYNGLGLRTSDTITPSGGSETTQHFVWNTTTSVPDLVMDSKYAYIYGPSGTPFEEVKLSNGTIHYLVSDSLGSVRGVVSSAGSLTASTSYDAWGNPETSGGLTSYTPFGFAGGYTDSTLLIYLENRYYDPTTGMFFTVDPDVNETGQLYAYAGDDPVNGTDPLGLWGWNPISDVTQAAGDVSHFVVTHKKDIEVGAGVALGIAAAATGVGAIVEGATLTGVLLGAGSVAAGAGASALDYGSCVNDHNAAACVGLGFGATGVVAGGFGLAGAGLVFGGVIAEDSLAASTLGGIGAFGWNVGIAGTIFDATTQAASASTLQACNPTR